jgi:hypothetical protein
MKANAIGSVSAPLGATRPICWPVFVTAFFLGTAQKAVPQRKLITSKTVWPLYIGYLIAAATNIIFFKIRPISELAA